MLDVMVFVLKVTDLVTAYGEQGHPTVQGKAWE
jgi:hypothetical protein